MLPVLMRRPSYYFRGAPLMLTAALGLMFMLWARNWSAAQQEQARQTTLPAGITNSGENLPGGPGTQGPSTVIQPGTLTTDDGGGQVNNSGPATAPAAGEPARSPDQPAAGAPRSGFDTRPAPGPRAAAGENRPVPRFPQVTPHRSARNDQPRRASDAGQPSGMPGLPPPRIDTPVRSNPPIRSLPPASPPSGPVASSGGGPVNPGGSRPRGYVRVSPYRVAPAGAPARPSSRAIDTERAAAADARSGRADRAADRVTSTIAGGGGTAWNYQHRALLNLESGDYARAADDFNTAIAAYRDQIRRGENVAEARKGLRACQDGLQLANANLRR